MEINVGDRCHCYHFDMKLPETNLPVAGTVSTAGRHRNNRRPRHYQHRSSVCSRWELESEWNWTAVRRDRCRHNGTCAIIMKHAYSSNGTANIPPHLPVYSTGRVSRNGDARLGEKEIIRQKCRELIRVVVWSTRIVRRDWWKPSDGVPQCLYWLGMFLSFNFIIV